MNNNYNIRCDVCGQFISQEDLAFKQARADKYPSFSLNLLDGTGSNVKLRAYCKKHNKKKPFWSTLMYKILKLLD